MDTMWLIFVVFVPLITYWYMKKIHTHWESQNVPSIPNPNVIFGHMLPVITIKESVSVFINRAYENFNSSMVGFYFMRVPGIIVREPDLVKSVLQTNFSSFHDNYARLNEKNDPVMAKHPFFTSITSDAELWKERRSRASNSLSGKKLKYLAVIIQEVCNQMETFVERKIEQNGGYYECELKQHFSRCTGEVVANSAFAIQGQSFEDNPDRLAFTEFAKTLFEPSFINGIKQAFLFFLPAVANCFGMGFFDEKTDGYMRQNIMAILKKRRETGDAPNDYLQFSMESSSDLDGILADVFNFYADVYETSSAAMAYLFYHLSLNPEIQSKVRDHVRSVLKESNGEQRAQVSFESVKKMAYLDQVISESLRMIPPAGSLMKVCTQEITLKGADGVTCHLMPGNPICIPVMGLQHDQKYWPNPEVFDPERFSPENQMQNNKYTFLPFGEGPRKCTGMRLALMLIKQATATLIIKFTIDHSPKTKVPLEIEPASILPGFKGGLWARFKQLNLY